MTDRDRLAADLQDLEAFGWLPDYWPGGKLDADYFGRKADRLIALGWTRLDEERLARALAGSRFPHHTTRADAAAIAKAYREDTDDDN